MEFRSQLGRVRGLGASHGGVHHFWVQRISGIALVPLVIWFTGERKGDHEVKPPLADLADVQIELYRALSREDEILNFAGYPMLSGNGFAKPAEPIIVGPRSVLYAPGGEGITTSWSSA